MSQVNFNNVISMGVSYSWSHQSSNGQNIPCGDLTNDETFIKREKNVTLDVLNLDLNNNGGQVVGLMGQSQKNYVNPNPVAVYANGAFAGKGKLSNFSISEGSQTNAVITTLSYHMGNSSDEEDFDQDENPVSRNEEITVSRDLKNKSYKIDHTYSVSFGSDFDLVSDYPLYKNNPSYHSVDARLALGEDEANSKLNQSPIDYSQYIDLSNYATANGWDLTKLGQGCSGAFSSSSVTKDFINGDYSATKTTEIRYTGENLSKTELDDYSIDYTISWETREVRPKISATFLRMNGTIVGNGSISCGSENNKITNAEKGYQEFVTNGTAKKRIVSFFNSLKHHKGCVGNNYLHDIMFDIKKTECIPTVNVNDEKNNGTITFSFEMNNDSGLVSEGLEEGQAPYTRNDYHTISQSQSKGCNDEDVTIYEAENGLTMQGLCGKNINAAGQYEKFNSIAGIFSSSIPALGKHYSADPRFWSAKRSTESISPYKGSATYSIMGNDERTEKKCKEQEKDPDDCDEIIKNIDSKVGAQRIVDSITSDGMVSEIKGLLMNEKHVNINVRKLSPNCDKSDYREMAARALEEIQNDQPKCFTSSLSWTYRARFNDTSEFNVDVQGYEPSE